MHDGRRTAELGLLALALASLIGGLASLGQKARLREAIDARGELSYTGLTRQEFDNVVDLVFATSLVAFASLVVVSLVLVFGLRRDRPWASFWIAPLGALVMGLAVAGIAGDVVAPRARGALLAAAAAAVVLLLTTVLAWRRSKSGPAESPPSVASSA